MAKQSPQFNLRLEPELKAWLDTKAKTTRLSRTWLVNDLIRKEMQQSYKDDQKRADLMPERLQMGMAEQLK
ncbi:MULTISPECIES: hypothetical protein [unclassified Halomonas]|uniref:hypothetical protein n=1 Tax=unclassified Halomonas TaxID=2609666 RepID=UPI000480F244|nr:MULTISPECIES: hypothetical protein [unclassified Halomonas]PKH63467.1 hypothetical protein CXF94_01410 [Halomonas sp. Choline-3u-9]QGQ69832.1 hypothetical protein FDY98_06640 [Halomonas sp. PA16-9]